MLSEYDKHRLAMKNGQVKEVEKKTYRIPKQSKKRIKEQAEYVKAVKEIITDETVCKIGAPGCTRIPSGLHHLQKRSPGNLTKKSNVIPCCSSCNLWIEENSKQAKEQGFTISKFKNEPWIN